MRRIKLGRYIVVKNKRQLKEILTLLDRQDEEIVWFSNGKQPLEYIPDNIPFPYYLVIHSDGTMIISAGAAGRYTVSGLEEIKYEDIFPAVKLYREIAILSSVFSAILVVLVILQSIIDESFTEIIVFLILSLVAMAWIVKYTVDKEKRRRQIK